MNNTTAKYIKTTNEWFDESCSNARSDFNMARNAFNRVRNEESHRNFTRTRLDTIDFKLNGKLNSNLN